MLSQRKEEAIVKRIKKVAGNEVKILIVPASAFDNFYKGAGWTLADEEERREEEVLDEEELVDEGDASEEDEWADVVEDEVEKPLSEMNRSELEAKALSLGVDLTGLTSNKQYREAIKAAM